MINEIAYFLLKTFVFFIAHLPRKFGLKIFGLVGYIWFLLDKKRRGKAFENITTKLDKNIDKKDAHKLIRKNFEHFCQSMFEVLWGTRLNPKDFDKWFEVEGREVFEAVKQKDIGIFLITGHFGLWEFLLYFLEKEDLTWHTVYQPITPAIFDRFIKEQRQKFTKGNLFPMQHALKGIINAFEKKETVGLLIDKRVRPEKGVVTDFFGSRIVVNKNTALLALQTQVPVIPIYLVRQENNYKIILKPAIEAKKTGDEIKDIEVTAQKFITSLEEMIREHPEQYPWFYNRWKPRPYSRLPE